MRIVALVSWFEENPRWLRDAILSLDGLVDMVVAVDGAYATFPQAKAKSSRKQYDAIETAAMRLGVPCHIHTPSRPWQGGEVQKRSAMFNIGLQHATPNEDWYLIFDADERVVSAEPDRVRTILATTPLDVGQVMFDEPGADDNRHWPVPIVFRAIPGLHVVGSHYTYRCPDGRYLWGNARNRRLAPRVALPIVVEHLTRQRANARRNRSKAYYRHRDQHGLESDSGKGWCGWDDCKDRAVRNVEINLRPYTANGRHHGHIGDWITACDKHARMAEARKRYYILGHGGDPNTVVFKDRPGPAPDMEGAAA
jgi:hypothetical protein